MKRVFFTDGSSRGNPGPGGFGLVELYANEIKYWYSYQDPMFTTNNQMELMAILYVAGMATASRDDEFIIFSDSAYAVNTINDWMWTWSKNDWLNSKKQKIENLEIIKTLYNYFSQPFFNVTVRKITGHDGLIGNELADRLAKGDINSFKKLATSNELIFEEK